MKEKNKIMFIREIEKLVRNIADKKRWDCYEILYLDITLNNEGNFQKADITIIYKNDNDNLEVITSKFNKITEKNFFKNARIHLD